MPDPDPMIATRVLVPPVRADLFPRPALLSRLDQVNSTPLTLISAPPGFGKSTLAAGWLWQKFQHGPAACAWLTLQPSNNHPVAFWRDVLAALRQVLPDFGVSLAGMLAAAAPLSPEMVAGNLVNELARLDRPVFLALDDAQVVKTQEIYDGLNLLLDHAPSDFHLILMTREDPPLALARRRARRQVLELRAADLRFQPDEIGGYFQQTLGLELTPEQAGAIDRLVEGWAVGLQLTALTLQGQSDPDAYLQSLTRVDSAVDFFVADYLINEVLTVQPREVREFLLRTSVLDELSAPLCEAVMQGSDVAFPPDEERLLPPYPALLERLERSNLFLTPLDPRREWFRFHRQFAALLRERLRRQYGREETARLQGLASRWFEGQDDPIGAIDYAIQSGDFDRSALLLQRYAPRFFIRADLPRLLAWAELVPETIREKYPNLGMAAAWAALATNRVRDAVGLLNEVERGLGHAATEALGPVELEPALKTALLEILVLRLRLEEMPDPSPEKLKFLQTLSAVLETLPDEQMGLFTAIHSLKPVAAFNLAILMEMTGDARAASPVFARAADLALKDGNHHIFLLSLSRLGNIQMQTGQFDGAARTLEDALARAGEMGAGHSPFAGLAYNGLGWLAYYANDLAEARERFGCARELAGPWSSWESLVPAALGLARVHQALDDSTAAVCELEDFLRTKKSPFPGFFSTLEMARAELLALNGDASDAGKYLARHAQAADDIPMIFCPAVGPVRARLLLLLDRGAEARALLETNVTQADAAGQVISAAQARVELARALAADGEIRPAAEALLAALSGLQRAGLTGSAIRVVLDGGEVVRRLLLTIRSTLDPGPALAGLIRSLLTHFVSGEEAYPGIERDGGLIEPLSDREREVLVLLAEGLANKDIAARLVVSLATVKTHVANIYQKLDAASRTQAVARAQILGLLRK